ncbi:hypothetical protein Daesc_005786 [Daldinia eschscholtzii]|uniref:Uncharacterized protein n=1 Tax=Daldinia eschscholtzii TaxID=292717 RepID=A0AAX6MMR4_9PEZI
MLCIASLCDLCTTKPNYTEQDTQDLSGELCAFTGANTGPSKASRTLFRENAIAWIAMRNEEKGRDAPPPSLLEIPPPRLSDLATDHRQEVDQEGFFHGRALGRAIQPSGRREVSARV